MSPRQPPTECHGLRHLSGRPEPAPSVAQSPSRPYPAVMPYPSRPVLETLPEFAGTNVVKPTPEQRAALLEFVAQQYRSGRSLRELAELTGRSETSFGRPLAEAAVPRRSPAAYRATGSP